MLKIFSPVQKKGRMRPLYAQALFVILAFVLMVVSNCLYISITINENSSEFAKMTVIISVLGALLAAALILVLTRIDSERSRADIANRQKTNFLANMSHELRTPLNVVIGLTDLILENDNLPAGISKNLYKISNAGGTLLSIVNDLLDISKIESGKLVITPVEYYMASLLNDVITLVITRMDEKPIKFHLNINDDLPSRLYGDDLRIKQILNNLLSNAIKYTHSGTIELGVSCSREGLGDVHMDITVSDTGIGIREDDQKKLFDAYYQVDTRASRNIEGTGLGLSITKRIAELMGGNISVESEFGKGSSFHVKIRQSFISNELIGHAVAENLKNFRYGADKHMISKKLVRVDLSGAKVLVVDDMQTNLDVAAGLLRKYKMQVDCVTSGQAAINRIKSGDPVYNVVFMDHMMPGMDGIEAAEAIRALGTEYSRKVPIIALTANAVYGTENMFYKHGFQAFLSKPIDIMYLDAVVKKWVWVQNESQEENTSAGLHESNISVNDENVKDKDTAISIAGVDTETGLSLYAGEMDIYLPLLRSYVSNTPVTLDKLRSVSEETLPEYVINVHGLKGTSASIGAEAVREAALNLETMSRAGDLNGVLARNDILIKDAENIVANIKLWLGKYDASNLKPRLQALPREVLTRLRQSCENYDMKGIDKAMSELESADYEQDADLIAWLKEKISVSEIAEVVQRLLEYHD
jgi:signal transduction histidine kinase/CheY-like chemotaxis protein